PRRRFAIPLAVSAAPRFWREAPPDPLARARPLLTRRSCLLSVEPLASRVAHAAQPSIAAGRANPQPGSDFRENTAPVVQQSDTGRLAVPSPVRAAAASSLGGRPPCR